MTCDPGLHHRRSIRLPGYDYATGGAYFVTICTQAKKCTLGEIVDGEMILNEAGRRVQETWQEMPRRFERLILDAFQIMPNHLHAIFVLPGPGLEPALAAATGAPIIQPSPATVGAGLVLPEARVGARLALPKSINEGDVGAGLAPPNSGNMGTASRAPTMAQCVNQGAASRAPTVGAVVGAFKSICTIKINRIFSRAGTRLLQRNFYEHIIRDVEELEIIRDYIIHNPQRWLEDPENPNT